MLIREYNINKFLRYLTLVLVIIPIKKPFIFANLQNKVFYKIAYF